MADGAVATDTLTGYVGQDTTHSFCVGTRILTSSAANPSVITTGDSAGVAAAHGFRAGQTVYIVRHYGSSPAIDGSYVVTTVPAASTFTIAVNCTTGGYEGFVTGLTSSISGYTLVLTIKDSDTAPTFTKTINCTVTSAANREFNAVVLAATSATIPVAATHKYDLWRTDSGTAWVFADGTYVQKTERRVTPP